MLKEYIYPTLVGIVIGAVGALLITTKACKDEPNDTPKKADSVSTSQTQITEQGKPLSQESQKTVYLWRDRYIKGDSSHDTIVVFDEKPSGDNSFEVERQIASVKKINVTDGAGKKYQFVDSGNTLVRVLADCLFGVAHIGMVQESEYNVSLPKHPALSSPRYNVPLWQLKIYGEYDPLNPRLYRGGVTAKINLGPLTPYASPYGNDSTGVGMPLGIEYTITEGDL